MDTQKKRAILVGALFILATLSSSLGFYVRDPLLEAPGYLAHLYSQRTRVIIGVLLLLVDSAAVVLIPAVLFPILRKHDEALALGYLGFRVVESVVVVVGEISLLALLALSQGFVQAGAPDASHFQAQGALLLTVYRQGTHVIGIMVVFALTALILNSVLYRSRLVPRWISTWGLLGAALLLAAGLLELLGPGPFSTISTVLVLPIAVQEMVFAVWLIAKGFNSAALDVASKEGKR
jgi:hypothetical protein